jgi:hypothetical protein
MMSRWMSCNQVGMRPLHERQIIFLFFFVLGETFSFHIPCQKHQVQVFYALLTKKIPFFACLQISLCRVLNQTKECLER